MPKTEKELEIYFKFQELLEAKRLYELPYSMKWTPKAIPGEEYIDTYKKKYDDLKTEYLTLANS